MGVRVGRLPQGTAAPHSQKLGQDACVCQLSISAARGMGISP